MATRGSKKSAAECEDDETETLNTKSMERLVTYFSKAIKTAMTAGVSGRERELEDITFAKSGNDVRAYLT